MGKKAFILLMLLMVLLRFLLPQMVEFSGAESLETAVTALGRTLLG